MKNPEFKVKVKDKKWDLIFNQEQMVLTAINSASRIKSLHLINIFE